MLAGNECNLRRAQWARPAQRRIRPARQGSHLLEFIKILQFLKLMDTPDTATAAAPDGDAGSIELHTVESKRSSLHLEVPGASRNSVSPKAKDKDGGSSPVQVSLAALNNEENDSHHTDTARYRKIAICILVCLGAIAVGVGLGVGLKSHATDSNLHGGTNSSKTSTAAAAAATATATSYPENDMVTQRGSNTRAGYFPNASLDPAVISSSNFGRAFELVLPNSTTSSAAPLVYTLPTGTQVVVAVDDANNVYVVNAKSGALINHVKLGAPANIGRDWTNLTWGGLPLNAATVCSDSLGIRSTPVIDSSTGTLYLFAMTYADQAVPSGAANIRHMFHALKLPELTSLQNFPVSIHGTVAQNSPAEFDIYFESYKQMQRTALTQLYPGGPIYAGFGSFCDAKFNYTGWVFGMHPTAGTVVTSFTAAVADPNWSGNALEDWGPGAAIWQSGGGFASDSDSRFFFATGNSDPTFSAPSSFSSGDMLGVSESLSVGVIRFETAPNTATDYFSPANHYDMNLNDLDLSSAGVTILDSFFTDAFGKTLCVAGGKDTELWILDCDNLGGYNEDGSNAVIQALNLANDTINYGATWTQVANYPEEGGFVYHVLSGGTVQAYQLVVGDSGTPVFVHAGQSDATVAAGAGAPIVTSLAGQTGSAVLWVIDGAGNGLCAFSAIPDSNGIMKTIYKDSVTTLNRIQPAIGSGRLFLLSYEGSGSTLIAYGAK
ncbi:hypothetical protein HDU84_003516 [Entophlyctis sp. JEL0112]|nr:hypothetical protein HDU84_003516 [Entophlyctis sp. JEL0112]